MSIHSNLRRQFPYLTPPFVGEDEEVKPKIRVAFGTRGLSGVEDLKTPPPQAMAGGVRLPGITPPEYLPERNPYEGYTPERRPPSPINIRVGANTAGLDPVDRSVSVLNTQRQAAEQFPSSKVTESGEVLPPKMHHGWKDRLISIGKGALLGLERGGVGGGIAGAITGGVSPITIDKIQARRALERKTAEVGQQIDIEKGRAQIEEIKGRGGTREERQREAERDNLRQAWQAILASGQEFDPDNPEHKQIHDRATELGIPLPYGSKKRQAGAPLIRERQNADGTTSTLKSDDGGKTWVEIPELKASPKPGEGKPDYGVRAEWYYKKQKEAMDRKAALQAQLDKLPVPKNDDPDYWTITEQRERLQKQIDEAQTDAQDYRDKADEASTMPQSSRSQGDTRKGTISKEQKELWLRDNPGKTVEDLQRLYPNAVIAN